LAVRLQLTTFCPDRLQPFEVCSILSSGYHSGGFQNYLEASFYKGDKNQKKAFAFIKRKKNHNRFKNEKIFVRDLPFL